MLTCDVSAVPVDAVVVEALARLALGARQQGCQVVLRGASTQLRALIELAGLSDVLRPATSEQAVRSPAGCPGGRPAGGPDGSVAALEGQIEQREQSLRVEEERELPDPPRLDLEHL